MARRRRRYVVDQFQVNIFVRILVYAAIYQITVWNLMFCLRLLKSNQPILTTYQGFLSETYPMLLSVLVLAPVFAWDAVKYCHRVAGPIYRFRMTIRDITAGTPIRPIRLRESDELVAMQDELNRMIEALAARGAVALLKNPEQNPTAANETTDIDSTSRECAPLKLAN